MFYMIFYLFQNAFIAIMPLFVQWISHVNYMYAQLENNSVDKSIQHRAQSCALCELSLWFVCWVHCLMCWIENMVSRSMSSQSCELRFNKKITYMFSKVSGIVVLACTLGSALHHRIEQFLVWAVIERVVLVCALAGSTMAISTWDKSLESQIDI